MGALASASATSGWSLASASATSGWALAMDRLVELASLEHSFALWTFAAAILVGALCGLVGIFLVLQRLSLLGDALGHATFPGLCIAFLVVGGASGSALLVGALVAALLGAACVSLLGSLPRTRPEANIGIVLSVFFAFGVVIQSIIQRGADGSQAILRSFMLGNAAALTPEQITFLAIGAGALFLALLLSWRALALTTFDPEFAASVGFRALPSRLLLLLLVSAAVVLSIRAVGLILVAAMLIIPPSAALLVSRRLGRAAVTSALLGALAGGVGALLSYLFDGWATGPAMVLVAAAIFLALLVFGARQGRASSASAGGSE